MEIVKNKEIRRTFHNNEWWYVVEDVVHSFMESGDTNEYIQRMKQRDPGLSKGWVQIVHILPIETSIGFQEMQCANLEGIFRIIQSIPAPRPEPYKQWLAKIGYERIQEILDPESATRHQQGASNPRGNRASGSRKISGPIANFEHVLTMLGEATATEIADKQGAQNLKQNRIAKQKACRIVDEARIQLERSRLDG